MYMVSLVRETESDFRRGLELEPERIANWHHIWHYRRMGLYHKQLQPFVSAIPRDQLLILLYDDFRSNPAQVLRTCYEFLGVDPDFKAPREPESLRSGVPKNPRLQRLVASPGRFEFPEVGDAQRDTPLDSRIGGQSQFTTEPFSSRCQSRTARVLSRRCVAASATDSSATYLAGLTPIRLFV